jgi:lipid-binding SYLF domain-containing protein
LTGLTGIRGGRGMVRAFLLRVTSIHTEREPTMRTALVLALSATIATAAVAAPSKKETRILRDASAVVETLMATPDGDIPEDLLERAECIGVFPGVKKGAFVVGGEFGRGLVSCRAADGRMDAPAFYSIGGGSIGFQIGGSSTDIVFLVMNPDGIKALVSDRVTIGAEASAAAGPVGRTAHAKTDVQLKAQILSWSRSRGLFAGASLDGASVEPSEDANERLYGAKTSAKSILVDHDKQVPVAATRFVQVIRKHTARPAGEGVGQ